MIDVLEQYAYDDAYTYRFDHGPDIADTKEAALQKGLNCVALAHLAIAGLFDYRLPPELRCYELYNDDEHFRNVSSTDDMCLGDLVWFGVSNPKTTIEDFLPRYSQGELLNAADFPVKHVAICTGEYDEQSEPLLLHASYVDGTNAVWPLGRFAMRPRYRKLYGITRLKAVNNTNS